MTKLLTDDQFKTAYLTSDHTLSTSNKIIIQQALLRIKDVMEYGRFTYAELLDEIRTYVPKVYPEEYATIVYLEQLGFHSAGSKSGGHGFISDMTYSMREDI